MKIMRNIWRCSIGLILITSVSCATLSRESCERGDWYGIGYEDGSYGRPLSRLRDHKQACLEYSVLPEENTYQQGRTDGLEIYCTDENGYNEGVKIWEYQNVCPAELEPGFLRGYLLGLDAAENELHREISRKSRKIIKISLSLRDLEDDSYKKQKRKIERLES